MTPEQVRAAMMRSGATYPVLEQATGTAVRYATPEMARKARLNSQKLYMRARRTAEKAQNQQTEANQ